jgi:hypothetical protein
LSLSFSLAMRSSQDSTRTCSMLDCLAWDKQSLA